ncbi:MAG TPA: phosphoribosylglycinamide formyltransferase, partial [Chitinophagaceae bacterium]|nr:phosphoribosylglycinamide formyltransferase [Chitinophagaceae bacterium]
MKKIAVFASGAGSNAQKIIDHFRNHDTIHVALIVSNKPEAAVLKIAARENIPTLVIDKEKFFQGNGYVEELNKEKIDLIVLAGFLWKIPLLLIKAYPEKIINIHPALLPKYGGKGMYGNHVHQAVLNNREKESGITIHFVDEIYDHGQIIFQTTCP